MNRAVFLLDPDGCRKARPFSTLCHPPRVLRTRAEARTALSGRQAAVFVAVHTKDLLALLPHPALRQRRHRLLILDRVEETRGEILRGLFASVVASDGVWKLLPREELAEAVSAPDASDLIIGGVVDTAVGIVRFLKGDLGSLVVPASAFEALPRGPAPHFGAIELADFGRTVRLGEYEASADAILYEHDKEYRRRVKARRQAEDPSFGGALRRLRLQRGLGRGDFPGITPKEIARIEQGQIKKPHPATLRTLAERLSVQPEEIVEF